MGKRTSLTIAEVKALYELLQPLAANRAALPPWRVAALFRVNDRTVRRWAALGRVERLPGGLITARSLVDRLTEDYRPTANRNLLTEDD